MVKNVGQVDRALRIVAGIVIIVAGVVFRGWWGVIGLLLLITALIRYCPAYVPFGITTCRTKQ